MLLLFILGKSGIGTIGPSVSDWQAQRVAKKNYDLVRIDSTYIKHINDISYIGEEFVLPSQKILKPHTAKPIDYLIYLTQNMALKLKK